MELFITIFAKELAMLAIGGIAWLSIMKKRSIPCHSCRYLVKRGGSLWLYTCNRAGYSEGYDNPPKYCKYYQREEGEET